MINKIDLMGTSVLYELNRKKVKNINLRVRRDGTVAVSAHKRVPVGEIESFMRSRAGAILRAINEAETAARAEGARLTESKTVCVLGDVLTLIIKEGRAPLVEIEDGALVLTVTDKDDLSVAENVLRDYLDRLCADTVLELCERAYPRFAERGAPIPKISFRRMRTRWGSCNPRARRLNFNLELVKLPVECIEYVVYHEFTHFLHADHSKAFHSCLEEYMPDAKSRRKLIRELSGGQIEQN